MLDAGYRGWRRFLVGRNVVDGVFHKDIAHLAGRRRELIERNGRFAWLLRFSRRGRAAFGRLLANGVVVEETKNADGEMSSPGADGETQPLSSIRLVRITRDLPFQAPQPWMST